MRSYCFECKEYREATMAESKEIIEIKGTNVEVLQRHAYCPVCHEEITPESIADENIMTVHEAYREAIGSIRISEMQRLLDKYDIRVNPMSKLLGMGENSLERQMKHTVPSKEFADKLRRLFNPFNMLNLLAEKGSNISGVAFRKALNATLNEIQKLISIEEEHSTKAEYYEVKSELFSSDVLIADGVEDGESMQYIPSFHENSPTEIGTDQFFVSLQAA